MRIYCRGQHLLWNVASSENANKGCFQSIGLLRCAQSRRLNGKSRPTKRNMSTQPCPFSRMRSTASSVKSIITVLCLSYVSGRVSLRGLDQPDLKCARWPETRTKLRMRWEWKRANLCWQVCTNIMANAKVFCFFTNVHRTVHYLKDFILCGSMSIMFSSYASCVIEPWWLWLD